ncbi:MAG: SDR family oxidoreductase [Gammaproteobacteria bacterium]|nr:SDR family oxidoreductase [Gammaproteobacteria bacterium]
MAYVLIIGAKSDIAKALAREYASQGYDLYLGARSASELEAFANDLRIRTGREVICTELDVVDFDSHATFYENLEHPLNGVICTVGYLGEQSVAQSDFQQAQQIIDTNYTGVVSLLNIIADDFERKKEGFIIALSSVAGDRGRQSNYLYGSAKAALTAYLSGLRNRLFKANVQVLTVKPGFVDTQMTAGMDLPEKLTAQPSEVAEIIYKAQQKGKDVLYVKWMWQWIMLIIRHIPEWLFKKTNL